jgi:hypothetical protein
MARSGGGSLGSVGRLTTSRFDLVHFVLKCRDPGVDPTDAVRQSMRGPCVLQLIDVRGFEDRSHVVWREAVQLFKKETTSFLRTVLHVQTFSVTVTLRRFL